MNTIKRLFIITSVVVLTGVPPFFLSSCIAPTKTINVMKERIPEVTDFISDYAESLSVLVEVQDRLVDTQYRIFKRNDYMVSDMLEVYDWSTGIQRETGIVEEVRYSDLLSEREQQAIEDILSATDRNEFSIYIQQGSTSIYYCEIYKGRDSACIQIDNYQSFELEMSYSYYYEKVNEDWFLRIFYASRG